LVRKMSMSIELAKPPYTREKIKELLKTIERLNPAQQLEALAGLSVIIDRQGAAPDIYRLGIRGELAEIGEEYLNRLPLNLCPHIFKSTLISFLANRIRKPISSAAFLDSLRRLHGYMTYMNPLAILYVLWKNPTAAKKYFIDLIDKSLLIDLANPDLRYTVLYRDLLVALSPILSMELFRKYYEPVSIPEEILETAGEINAEDLMELLVRTIRSYIKTLISTTQVLRAAIRAEEYLDKMKLETTGLVKYRDVLGRLVKTSRNLMLTSLETLTVYPEPVTAEALAGIVSEGLKLLRIPEELRLALNLILEASLAPEDHVRSLTYILGKLVEIIKGVGREELAKLCGNVKGRVLLERLARHNDKKWVSMLGVKWDKICTD